jgi:hypothetical protein
MNWTKVFVAGVAAGIVANLADFVMHGIIMADTYKSMPSVFTQEQASPFYFLAVSICTAIFFTILYAKTVDSWGGGWKGGASFGFWVGMVAFFPNFYNSLVIADFPYYLGWCWGGMTVISAILGGATVGALYKK